MFILRIELEFDTSFARNISVDALASLLSTWTGAYAVSVSMFTLHCIRAIVTQRLHWNARVLKVDVSRGTLAPQDDWKYVQRKEIFICLVLTVIHVPYI